MSAVLVEVCSRRFVFPLECPCCGALPDSELVVPIRTNLRQLADSTAREALFPYCRYCVEHVEHWDVGSMTKAAITLLGITAGLLLVWSAGLVAGIVLFLLAAILAHLVGTHIHARATSHCGHSCVSARRCVDYYGWSGSTSTLGFASPSYTARFAEQNSADLVSVSPELRRLLEANIEARRRVPTPAVASAIPPSPDDPASWIEHVERQPTRVLRRQAVTRALASLATRADREIVIAAAAHWELAPVVELLGRTPRRRRRARIDELAERIQCDNLAAPVVGAMLVQLERLLAEPGVAHGSKAAPGLPR